MTTSVAVLLGGWSAERDVSLSSGRECADALVRAGYDVREIDMNGDVATLISQLEDPRPDVVFNALHGRWGEDGIELDARLAASAHDVHRRLTRPVVHRRVPCAPIA